MSLDVYLNLKEIAVFDDNPMILIRRDGITEEIDREEWEEMFPGKELITVSSVDVYSANITHNLGKMAAEAGIYEHLWRPGEIGVLKAKQLIEPLQSGLLLLTSKPEQFKKLNPSNGWGGYDGLMDFVQRYLDACKKYPEADVSVCR